MQKVITVPFAKIDDAERMVYGYASTADRDSDGEIITIQALKTALPGYMRFASVREMHNAKPVGKTKQAEVDDNGLYIGAKIVNSDAWKMVQEGVYSAFSIGGKILERDETDPTIIKGLNLLEISLVDVPANANARIDLFKVADTGDDEDEVEKGHGQHAGEAPNTDVDPDHDGDNDTADSPDDTDDDGKDGKDGDGTEKVAAAPALKSEDIALYNRMVDRFGQEKADEVFKRPVTQEQPDDAAKVATPDTVKAEVEDEKPAEKVVDVESLVAAFLTDLYKDFDIDQISDLQSTAKKAEVRKLLEFAKVTKDIVAKARASADQDAIQAIHDHSARMGADCGSNKSGVKAGDLSKAYDQVSKYKTLLNTANTAIDKLNKQIADKEDYIEQLKKTPKAAMPITGVAQLPEGLTTIGKGDVKAEDVELNNEQRMMKAMREAREQAFHK